MTRTGRAAAGTTEPRAPERRALVLGTVSFGLAFAVWGLISAAAPMLAGGLALSATQTATLVALPVLLGSLLRIPVGLLADRFGGRPVLATILLVSALPALLLPRAEGYRELLWVALLLGVAGSAFAAGVGFVSRWTPAARQGGALGVFGLGNIGQSAVVFLGPLVAVRLGWPAVAQGMAAGTLVWAVLFFLLARDAPRTTPPPTLAASLATARHPLVWLLSAFYALTFGGFVAFAMYLPTLLRDEFGFTPAHAGFRAAGFVVLATLARPVGGWLADRIGGARVLLGVFWGVVPFALLLMWPAIIPFTVGALGCATLLGLGNGAVFKLVPEHFPTATGTVTGVVGALGALGGFVPPLLLGALRDGLGTTAPGFALLAAAAAGLGVVDRRILLAAEEQRALALPATFRRTADRLRAGTWATLVTAFLVAAIVVGSRNLQHFDPALVVYTFGCIFATWGVAYHYAVWLQKPPTRLYWQRGWQLFARSGVLASTVRLLRASGTHLLGQGFIHHRSRLRYWMHQLLFWGCLLAAAITFPLVFGWIHFGTPSGDPMRYTTYIFGFPTASFTVRTVVSWLIFHGLDISAALVLAGIALSLWRRLRDRGAIAVQSFAMDLLPIFLLFAISVTGLALTVSVTWLRGGFYGFLSILHAITVVAALLFLPFGKFFHIFQRPAQLGVKLYQHAGDAGEGAHCVRCGERFASRLHVDDLKRVLPELGFDYRFAGAVDDAGATITEGDREPAARRPPGGRHWLDLCPRCKRATLATTQLRLRGIELDVAESGAFDGPPARA